MRLRVGFVIHPSIRMANSHRTFVPPAGADPSVPLEQLCWLAALCAAVLADAGDGETPLVPLPVAQAGEAAAAGGAGAGADPAQRLSAGLLALGGHCLVQAGQVGASPR